MKGCTRPEISGPDAYRSILTMDKLAETWVRYRVPREFDLELSNFDTHVNDPPLDKLGMYVEAFETGLRFSIPPFLLELLRYYNISLYTLIPNSLRLILGFLVIYFLAEIWPPLTLICAFYTIKRYPYAKDWWYYFAQRMPSL